MAFIHLRMEATLTVMAVLTVHHVVTRAEAESLEKLALREMSFSILVSRSSAETQRSNYEVASLRFGYTCSLDR